MRAAKAKPKSEPTTPAALPWPADKVERRSVQSLLAYPANARVHSDVQIDQIAASMTEFGWTMPILVDENGVIIAGHGRAQAAARLGLGDVPVMVARNWTDAQKRAYRLADNRLPENASWNEPLLKVELTELAKVNFDLSLIGFGNLEIVQFMTWGDPLGTMPPLPNGDRAPFQQMTFTVHDDQAAVIQRALAAAGDMGEFMGPNKNSNGNALARVCEKFLEGINAEREGHLGRPRRGQGRERAGAAPAL